MTEKSQKFECIKFFNAVLYCILLLRSQQVFFITCILSAPCCDAGDPACLAVRG